MSIKENIRRDLENKGGEYYADNYDHPTTSNYLRRLRRQYIQEWLNGIPVNARVLDLGCGPEILFKEVLSEAEEYVAVDLVAANIQKLKDGRVGSNVRLVEADADSFEWEKQYFDAIVCSGMLEYTENPESNLLRLLSYLKAGGMLICSFPNGLSPYRRWSEHVYRHFWQVKNKLVGKESHYYPRCLFIKSRLIARLEKEPYRLEIRTKEFGHKLLLQPSDILLKQLDHKLTCFFEQRPFFLSKYLCSEFLMQIVKCE